MAYLTNTIKNVEGTEISIDDSYKLKDLVLEGDTYQETTTGKNLSPVNFKKISGTVSNAKTIGSINETVIVKDIPVEANTTYIVTWSKPTEVSHPIIFFYNGNMTATIHNAAYTEIVGNGRGTQVEISQDGNKNTDYQYMAISTGNASNYAANIQVTMSFDNLMIRKSTISDDEYEPYTGGIASPNPDYPQEIQTVTGEQKIIIETRNKLDLDKISVSNPIIKLDKGVELKNAWANTIITNANLTKLLKPNTRYTCRSVITIKSRPSTINQAQVNLLLYRPASSPYGSVGIGICGVGSPKTAPLNTPIESIISFVTPSDFTSLNMLCYTYYGNNDGTTTYSGNGDVILDELMIVEGNYTASDFPEYKDYKHKEYEINLGKNLLNIPDGTYESTTPNITAVVENGVMTLNGTASATRFVMFDIFTLPKGTYTIKANPPITGASGGSIRLATSDAIIPGASVAFSSTGSNTFTTTEDLRVGLQVRTSSGVSYDNFVIKPQLEKGDQATTYAPHFEPIKLGKITDNHKDKIDKSTRKNLLNRATCEEGKALTWATGFTFNETGSLATDFIKVEPQDTMYCTYNCQKMFYDENKNYLGCLQLDGTISANSNANISNSFTIPNVSNICYVRFGYRQTYSQSVDLLNANIMVNTGTALPYEPYGTSWYLKKYTNKIVLDGTESWGNDGDFYYTSKYGAIFRNVPYTRTTPFCTHAKYKTKATSTATTDFYLTSSGAGYPEFSKYTFASNTDFKNWLVNNNVEIEYVLETPTYTKITNQQLIDQLEAIRLLEDYNEITVDSVNLPATLNMDYYSTENPYQDAVYSQDDKNDLKIYFNDVELEDAGRYCERITRTARIIPNDGGKRFNLDNFIATNVEVILHDVDLEDIVDQVRIEIGTDIGNNTYQYIPLGIFNIQDTPVKDGNKITLKLRDNRVKFDFNYNAYPLIQELGGTATKRQILEDICEKAGVENAIEHFDNEEDEIGIYEDSITATVYVSYLMEQAGLIATIDRYGRLTAVDLSKLDKWEIPYSIVESEEKGEPYSIERVVYEGGTIKYQTSEDETLDTLYLNSANPYITSDSQVENILSKLENFEIDSVKTKRVLGNPAIDPYDIIEVYNDLDGTNDIVFRTLGNTKYTFNGVHRDTFDTQIGKEQRKENVSKNSPQSFQKYARAEIDNINATITQTVAEVTELQESIEVFSVDLSQYNLIIATDNGQKPYTTETLSINYYGYYKGQQVTPTVSISGSQTGVTTSSSSTAVNFAVSNTTAIQNKNYTYTLTFTYSADNTTYTLIKKVTVALSIQGQQGQQGPQGETGSTGPAGPTGPTGPAGQNGTSTYFYVRYSKNSDGNPMTTTPQSDTQYMGVASTTSSTAPTSYTAYTWSKTKGETGQQGIPGQAGEDGTSSYLHIKWSDDGEHFTEAQGGVPEGKTPARWQGTYVDTNETDSSVFSDYNWVDTGIYVQDELNNLQSSIGEVDARVTDTNTNLNNNYYNKDQVDALSDANANNIATVTQRVVALEQTNSQFSINVKRVIEQVGASKVTTATGYVFDENGLNISKTGSEISNLLDNTGMFVKRNSTEMLGADATGVRAENLLVRKYLTIGTNSRFEDYETSRTACFYIGGGN